MKIYRILLISLLSVVVLFMGCSKGNESEITSIKVTPSVITMYFDETTDLAMICTPSDIHANYLYQSTDPYVAKVDANGIVYGAHVGECKITVSTNNHITTECKVTIAPRSTFFKEPFLVFGSTKTDIMAYEEREFLSETENGNLIFAGENPKVYMVYYSFENNKMTGARIYFVNTSSCFDEVNAYLSERYNFSWANSDYVAYKGKKAKAFLGVIGNNPNVIYMP